MSTNNLLISRDVEGVEFAKALDLIQGNIVRGQWLGRFGEYVLELLLQTETETNTG